MKTLPPNHTIVDAKKHLAWLIVSQFHGEEAADRASAAWERHVAGEDPIDIPDAFLPTEAIDSDGRIHAPLLLKLLGLESSTSKARAVIKQGGFNVGPDRERIDDPNTRVEAYDGLIVRVGKKRVVRVKLKEAK